MNESELNEFIGEIRASTAHADALLEGRATPRPALALRTMPTRSSYGPVSFGDYLQALIQHRGDMYEAYTVATREGNESLAMAFKAAVEPGQVSVPIWAGALAPDTPLKLSCK